MMAPAPKHTYRIEVGQTKAAGLSWFLRLAKKEKGYRVEGGGDFDTHIVETESLDTIIALWQIVGSWKNTAFYIDGQIIPRSRIARLVWQIDWRPERTRELLNQIIRKKAREDDEGTWRMGMGGDPAEG